MTSSSTIPLDLAHTGVLLRGEATAIDQWTREWNWQRVCYMLGLIIVGSGLYGAAMGYCNSPLQALYSGIKLPMVILLTTLGNALLNGMLAPLLGLNIGFRQSLMAIFSSFAIASVILGGFSPLIFFLVWNAPEALSGGVQHSNNYSLFLVTETAGIAFAGIMANVRLVQLLERIGGSASVARRVLLGWLAGNLFLGAQLSWNLRPFLGSRNAPVHFFSSHPFEGNFYETIYRALSTLF